MAGRARPSFQVEQHLAGLGIAHGGAVALGGRDDLLPVRAERHAVDVLAGAGDGLADRRAGARIPEPDRIVVAAGDDTIAIRAEGGVIHLLGVAAQARQFLAREGVDDAHGMVAQDHGDAAPGGREGGRLDVLALVELLLGDHVAQQGLDALGFRGVLQEHGTGDAQRLGAVEIELGRLVVEPQVGLEAHAVLLQQECGQRTSAALHGAEPDGFAVEFGKLVALGGAEHEHPERFERDASQRDDVGEFSVPVAVPFLPAQLDAFLGEEFGIAQGAGETALHEGGLHAAVRQHRYVGEGVQRLGVGHQFHAHRAQVLVVALHEPQVEAVAAARGDVDADGLCLARLAEREHGAGTQKENEDQHGAEPAQPEQARNGAHRDLGQTGHVRPPPSASHGIVSRAVVPGGHRENF